MKKGARRVGDRMNLCLDLIGKVETIQLKEHGDTFIRNLNKKSFTVKSMYTDLMSGEGVSSKLIS